MREKDIETIDQLYCGGCPHCGIDWMHKGKRSPVRFRLTLKTVRVKKSETATQDKATAKTIADTDTMQIQVVHDVLIVTFKDSGDTVYIKLSNKRF